LPGALRRAPVDTFQKHRELRWCQCHGAARLAQRGPDEMAMLQPLREQTEPVAVPKEDLDRVRLPAAEGEQMTGERVLLELRLHQHGEAVETLPHVGVTEREVDLHAQGNDQHLASSSCCATYLRTASGSQPGGANTRRPSASSTATAPGGIGRIFFRTAA